MSYSLNKTWIWKWLSPWLGYFVTFPSSFDTYIYSHHSQHFSVSILVIGWWYGLDTASRYWRACASFWSQWIFVKKPVQRGSCRCGRSYLCKLCELIDRRFLRDCYCLKTCSIKIASFIPDLPPKRCLDRLLEHWLILYVVFFFLLICWCGEVLLFQESSVERDDIKEPFTEVHSIVSSFIRLYN